MIDIEKAKEVFKKYVSDYNAENEKINIKIEHIFKVAEISREIARNENLDDEQISLAELIGLLHDIGRFEQVKKYNTFLDKDSENHAEIGIRVLFDEGLIFQFLDDRKYDEIIKNAILNHNKIEIDKNINDDETILFCKIIRDADKVDCFRVLTTEDISVLYWLSDIRKDVIRDEIFEEFVNKNIINYSLVKVSVDLMIAQIGYVFDFNYSYCLKKIKDEKYIDKMVERIDFENSDTKAKMQEILKITNDYMDRKLKQN